MTCVDRLRCFSISYREVWPYCALTFLAASTLWAIGLGHDLATVLVVVLIVLTVGPGAISRLHQR
ncbi:hypothetical protein [Nocardiopsis rhodophaea]|uniref:hypothetical protein n=1 Tax=Nocardiopsis rhodophaea TaxID=280238 RepID=UPI0031D47D94